MSRLWDLVSHLQRIEPWELKEAIEEQLAGDEWDYRNVGEITSPTSIEDFLRETRQQFN